MIGKHVRQVLLFHFSAFVHAIIFFFPVPGLLPRDNRLRDVFWRRLGAYCA